jgi:hypothetical protein
MARLEDDCGLTSSKANEIYMQQRSSLVLCRTQVMHVCDSKFPMSLIIFSLLRRCFVRFVSA